MRKLPIILTLLLVLGTATSGAAQTDATTGTAQTKTSTLEELHQMLLKLQDIVEQQDSELQRQSDLIAKQQGRIEDQKDAIATMNTTLGQVRNDIGTTAQRSAAQVDLQEKLSALEKKPTTPEMPADVLRAGDFPGSIHLPGTNLNARVGGFVRLSGVNSLDPIGSDDRFIVGSIPPEGTASAENEARATISAKRSRINLDVRMDSTVGQFRAFIEGDFAGDGGTENYRLRHAYGQYNRLLVGQTWSTLMDLRAIPEEIDFEGLNSQVNVRHPIIRWGGLKVLGRDWAFALEDPNPSLTGGEGVSRFFDAVSNTSWNKPRGHLQLGVVARTLTGKITLEGEDGEQEEGPEQRTFAYGLAFSGSFLTDKKHDRDNIKWQVTAGEGVGSYINDMRSIGGQDGVFDPETGQLDALPALGAYIAYERWWRPDFESSWFQSMRSTFVYGYTYVDNFDYQDGGDYKGTRRVSANIMFSPISDLDIGGEILWGLRRNVDSSQGTAWQWQLLAEFRF